MTGKPNGVILAGGQSRRMGGIAKSQIELAGKPLMAHVIQRLQVQVGSLLLSSESRESGLEVFGFPVVPDLLPRHRGPLTGLCSALQYLEERKDDNGLVLCPCDAPFVPADLVARLGEVAGGELKPVAVVSYEGYLQPTFSLWQRHHLPKIRDAVMNRGEGGLKTMLRSLAHEIVEWVPTEPPPFYNVNTPEELQAAEDWLANPGYAPHI